MQVERRHLKMHQRPAGKVQPAAVAAAVATTSLAAAQPATLAAATLAAADQLAVVSTVNPPAAVAAAAGSAAKDAPTAAVLRAACGSGLRGRDWHQSDQLQGPARDLVLPAGPVRGRLQRRGGDAHEHHDAARDIHDLRLAAAEHAPSAAAARVRGDGVGVALQVPSPAPSPAAGIIACFPASPTSIT